MNLRVCAMAVLLSLPASAAVKQASPGLLSVEEMAEVSASPSAVFAALGRIANWWSSAHTYSGSSTNLHLDVKAGGLFSEHWKDGDVEHGRVINVQRDRLVRLSTALGPFQSMPVVGVLTFTLAPSGEGTKVQLTYLVSGDGALGLDKLAGIVDRVLGEQLSRLARYAETGKPETPASDKKAP